MTNPDPTGAQGDGLLSAAVETCAAHSRAVRAARRCKHDCRESAAQEYNASHQELFRALRRLAKITNKYREGRG